MQSHLRIGLVLKPQGVSGELKVHPLTDDPARFSELRRVWLKGEECTPPFDGYREIALTDTVVRMGLAYVKLEGIKTRDAAEKLRGCYLYVERADALPLGEDRWFISDLIGCTVVTDSGDVLGILTEVIEGGHHDVYVVHGARGCMFPALKRVVMGVEILGKRMIVNRQAWEETAVMTNE